MKAFRPAVVASCALLSGALLLAGAAPADENKPNPEHGTPVRSNAGFDLMKALVGEWEMPGKEGAPSTSVSFTLVSGGTALMESMSMGDARAAMITIYHADGEKLMMTHYCGANNQPRMRCPKPSTDGKSLDFEFIGGSNLPSGATGHMRHLTVTIEDPNHMSEAWTWKEGSKSTREVFHFARKAS